MKKYILAAFLMIGLTGFAQQVKQNGSNLGARPRAQRLTPDTYVKDIAKDLSLSEAQQAQVKQLLGAQRAEREAIREQRKTANDDKSRAVLKDRIEAEKNSFDAGMKKILTAEQFTKWQSMPKNRQAKISAQEEPNIKVD